MPFETVDETVVRQRQVKVCARCRGRMDEKVKHRGVWTTAGSIGGSVGTSMGGSMLLGSVLGPVGALGGAIGGAIVGSRAGAAASSGACDAIEATADDVCERCKAESTQRASACTDWGGGRLGSSDDPAAASGQASAQAPGGLHQQGEPTIADHIGQAASATGQTLGKAASATGETLSKAASATGETLSKGWSQLSKSVSSTFGGSTSAETQAASGGKSTSVPFAGSGHVLGSGGVEGSTRPISRLVGGSASQAPAQSARRSQMEEDEALARRLQEQFLREGQ
mmetsp:Transcript_65633/g.158716  ORF Transcript_65633/g.158716 Transcript_65633/m.158716 type:complete len:283 (-) Transcript_65633:217-1065(-)